LRNICPFDTVIALKTKKQDMRTLIILLLGFVALTAQAQTTPAQKIGHADWDYIFSQLPESKQIENELKTHGTQLDNQLKAKYSEYQAKVNAYQGMPATTPDAIKKDKETEITQLQESIQKFQTDAQSSLQKKQTELMAPVFAKVAKAIEEVAKENGFTYILTPQMIGGGDVILYGDEQYNISTLVLKKLGITPAPAATTATIPVKKP
jgi:outer membrane protein